MGSVRDARSGTASLLLGILALGLGGFSGVVGYFGWFGGIFGAALSPFAAPTATLLCLSLVHAIAVERSTSDAAGLKLAFSIAALPPCVAIMVGVSGGGDVNAKSIAALALDAIVLSAVMVTSTVTLVRVRLAPPPR